MSKRKPCDHTLTTNRYGFTYGPVSVVRVLSDDKGILLALQSKRQAFHVWVTPTGLIRVRPTKQRIEVDRD